MAWLTVLSAHQGRGDYDELLESATIALAEHQLGVMDVPVADLLSWALHAEPLIDRAAHELRASGETARKRDPSTLTQLTPTELHIAQLVSQGMTNKEVAEQCWVSARTVAFHLRNVFTKTGVTSRSQLVQLDLN